METTYVAFATGIAKEVRAALTSETVTLESRFGGDAWSPLTIGDLHDLISARNGFLSWLEGLGVLWGAWVGRGSDEIATFGRSVAARPLPRRRRRSPVFRAKATTRVA